MLHWRGTQMRHPRGCEPAWPAQEARTSTPDHWRPISIFVDLIRRRWGRTAKFDSMREQKTTLPWFGISIVWRRTDFADTTWARALLYDDGVHEDGLAGDRNWAGTLDEVLPPGAEIAFYLEGEDVSGVKRL